MNRRDVSTLHSDREMIHCYFKVEGCIQWINKQLVTSQFALQIEQSSIIQRAFAGWLLMAGALEGGSQQKLLRGRFPSFLSTASLVSEVCHRISVFVQFDDEGNVNYHLKDL